MLKYWLPRQICMTFTCNHFFYFTRALDCIASRQWLNFLSRKDSITKSLLNYEKWCTSQKRIWNFPSSSSLSGLLMWKITNWRKEPLWSTFPTQMQLSRGRNLAKFCSRENPQFWKVTRQVFLDLFEVACKRDTSYFSPFPKEFSSLHNIYSLRKRRIWIQGTAPCFHLSWCQPCNFIAVLVLLMILWLKGFFWIIAKKWAP